MQGILEERFQTGLELKQAGEHARSVELLQRLAEEHPGFGRVPEALFAAGRQLELYLDRPSDALLTYLLLERDFPEHALTATAQPRIARLYKYRLDDCERAISAYQRVLERPEQDNPRWQYEVADCYFRLNNFEQARIEFESLQKNYPASDLNAEVQYRIAVTYALEGQLPEAAATFRRVTEKWPNSPYAVEARYGLAGVLEEQEELREALEILEALVGSYPNPELLELKIEKVRERMEKKKKAI